MPRNLSTACNDPYKIEVQLGCERAEGLHHLYSIGWQHVAVRQAQRSLLQKQLSYAYSL